MFRLLLPLLFLSMSGCFGYRTADNDPEVSCLVGRRYVLDDEIPLPLGQRHWLPSFSLDKPPGRTIARGTVLRVDHIERFDFLDYYGHLIYAVAENGPQRGSEVVIGERNRFSYGCQFTTESPSTGLSQWTGMAIQPSTPEDRRHMHRDFYDPSGEENGAGSAASSRGRKPNVGLDTLEKVADALGCDARDLLTPAKAKRK